MITATQNTLKVKLKDLVLCNTELNPLDRINCLTFWGQYETFLSQTHLFFLPDLKFFTNRNLGRGKTVQVPNLSSSFHV